MYLNRIIKIVISILVSFLLMCYLIHNYELFSIKKIVDVMDYKLLLSGLGSMFVTFLICGYRWKFIYPQYPFTKSFTSVVIAQAVNSIIPLRGGEILRAALLKKETGIPTIQTLGRIVIERLLDFFTLLCLLIISIVSFNIDVRSNAFTLLMMGSFFIIISIG